MCADFGSVGWGRSLYTTPGREEDEEISTALGRTDPPTHPQAPSALGDTGSVIKMSKNCKPDFRLHCVNFARNKENTYKPGARAEEQHCPPNRGTPEMKGGRPPDLEGSPNTDLIRGVMRRDYRKEGRRPPNQVDQQRDPVPASQPPFGRDAKTYGRRKGGFTLSQRSLSR